MRVVRSATIEAKKFMQKLGVDRVGVEIMAKKSELLFFIVRDLHVGAANILKQDALSIGADFAVPSGVVVCAQKRVDGLLMGTRKQMEQLCKKEMAQPFGLKELAKEIRAHLKKTSYPIKIMGIINANEDSFYPKSRFLDKEALVAIERMIEDGADIIDVGGMSTRPGSEEISEEEELFRVKPIIDLIYQKELFTKALFSIDTYRPKVAAYALERGFQILNDITALESEECAKIASSYKARVVLMHKKGTPKTMQQNPCYEDVVSEVSDFFAKRIQRAKAFGIEDIILDPGIGFGKRVQDNLLLLRDLAHFQKFGYEILVGASRKSIIDKIHPSSVERRLGGTLALHLHAVANGASIIRCHDVFEHKQAIALQEALREVV